MSANFGTALSKYTEGNINLENGVGFGDFLILSTNFNKTPVAGVAAAAVPEPSSLLPASLATLYLLGRRRRNRIR